MIRAPMDLHERYPTRFLRGYVKWKVKTDPIYALVPANIPTGSAPLVDVGCGVGILEVYLRTLGFRGPVTGIDHDEKKIGIARAVTRDMPDLTFLLADARLPLPRESNVVMFDLLHYFSDDDQFRILGNIATALPSGGVAVIRDGVREPKLRYWITYCGEVFARLNGWLKAERLNFPRREIFERAFPAPEFAIESRLFTGGMPTNNYLFVIRKR